ncbi:arginine N-methyltransferase, putative [Actinidia rufa]|uniref:Arginine N-methyltransferase, putative n=1 Tax=Actinidia rufa TaxID=165716 RepID=A0A7J0DFR0_9ERIC|nr:arginine N-methyltransferase, putative [Actinidia rufa]
MEDKKLDFNQPLLSVRRYSSTTGSEKDVKRKTSYPLPGVPVLPSYKSELKSGPVTNPGTVPFTWEQCPGRPKDERKSRTQPPEQCHIIPKLTAWEDYGIQKMQSKIRKVLISGDSDEAYQDALDTLSRTESFCLNCSVSGLSGFDGPEMKPSGTFSTDPQTRDFMMGRFLPAAKAMASETPQYASRKQPAVKEQSRQIINEDKRPPLHRPIAYNLPNYAEDDKEEESDGEDDDFDEPGNLSTKVCGLLPKFCLKGSLCLLNPVSGMSVRTRVPMSPAVRTQARFASTGSCQETENERVRVASHEQRSIGGPRKTELREYNNVARRNYNRVPHQSSYQKLEGLSLYRRLQGNELPQSSFCEEKRSLDVPKEAEIDQINSYSSQQGYPKSFQELLADQSTKSELGSASPVVEKTLYVDSVHKMVSPKLNSFSSDRKDLPNSIRKDSEIVAKVKGSEDTPSEMGMAILKGFGHDQDQQKLAEVENVENFQEVDSQFPLPPPLPKSPTESWLWRTLPSMSTRNASSISYLGARMNTRHQVSKTSMVDPKWETIVKTTKVRHQQLCFTEAN